MPRTKLTPVIRSTIIYAAASAAYIVAAEEALSHAAWVRAWADDDAAEQSAASHYDAKLARLAAIMDEHDVGERLRRHAIRSLADSRYLHRAAERFLRDQVIDLVGGLDPREGGTLLVHSLGEDWRTGPAVRLNAGRIC